MASVHRGPGAQKARRIALTADSGTGTKLSENFGGFSENGFGEKSSTARRSCVGATPRRCGETAANNRSTRLSADCVWTPARMGYVCIRVAPCR